MSGSTAPPGLHDLLDELGGEIVLRHVPGRQVLDLGFGAPRVTGWCRQRAAQVEVFPYAELAVGETVRLPWPEATFDVIYCLGVLAHLGQDEASSVAAARALLHEASRVLRPRGVALVQIENPTSLRGAYQGIRHPMTVVDRTLTVTSEAGVTRFDTLPRFLRLLPDELEFLEAHGVGVLPPFLHTLGGQVLERMLRRIERFARDLSPLRYFGGWLVIELRRLSPLPGTG